MEDLGIKLGSDDMVLWQNIINAREVDIKVAKENLKYFEAILEMAKEKLKKAEKEFK
jgi:hypothetical protein